MESHYFNIDRTQPFFITFVTAILAFKRVAKLMKKKFGCKVVKGRKLPDMFRKNAILEAERTMIDARKGIQTFTVTPNLADNAIYIKQKMEHSDSTIKTLVPKKKPNDSTTIIISVARHLNNHFSKSNGKNVTLAARLKRNLRVKFGPEDKDKAASEAKTSTAFESIVNRNNNVKEGKAVEKDDIQENLEYLPGTVIYYGAKVAIQARHGGFLSFHNATEIKASAHKILMQTKFIIINSSDLTDFGAVKYGDAIWLQAGQHEVLGANYVVNANSKGGERGERKICPALINCRRNNIFKAQQYGRWIVLNRDRPTETIGQMVLHYDRIILEQEWYFLASTSPYDAGMHRHGSNLSYGTATPSQVNLFQPDPDCTWKIHLLGLPGDDKGDEKQRQLLLHNAQDQIEASADHRYKKKSDITNSLRESLPPRLQDEAYFKENLKHKRSEESTQKYFIEKYSKMSQTGFTMYENSSRALMAIYGKDSKICQLKTDVNRLRLDRHGIIRPKEKIRIPDPRTVLQVEKDKYWLTAQALLIHTRAWAQLNAAMMPYYRIDRKKKIAAAIILQRWIRYLQGRTFSYGRAMRNLDEIIAINLERIRQKAAAAKMLALAPEPGSLEAAQALAATLAQGDSTVPVVLSSSNGLLDMKPKGQSGKRRKSSIINEFKRKQRNRLSFLIKPITNQANICQFPATPTTAAVVPPAPAHLLPVLCTPPTSPRDADPRTDSNRIGAKPVSLSNPAPFSGGPNGGKTFITANSQIVSNQALSNINETDEMYGEESDDDDDDDDDYDDEDSDSQSDIELARGQSAPLLSRGKSAQWLRASVKLDKVSDFGIHDSHKQRAKSAKLARDEEAGWTARGENFLETRRSVSAKGNSSYLSQSQSAPNVAGLNRIATSRPHTAGASATTRSMVDNEPSFANASFDVERNYSRPKEMLDAKLLAGLPDDVLTDTVKHLSLNRGLKFLRAASADPDKFKSVVVKRRQFSRK